MFLSLNKKKFQVIFSVKEMKKKSLRHAYKPLRLRTIPLNVVIHRREHFCEHECRCCQPVSDPKKRERCKEIKAS